MNDKKFTVMVAGVAKAGMEDYIKDYLTRLMEHSRRDKGCIIYNVHQSTHDTREFMMYSVWKSEEAFEEHNQKPELQEFKKELAPEMFDAQSPKTYWQIIE